MEFIVYNFAGFFTKVENVISWPRKNAMDQIMILNIVT